MVARAAEQARLVRAGLFDLLDQMNGVADMIEGIMDRHPIWQDNPKLTMGQVLALDAGQELAA